MEQLFLTNFKIGSCNIFRIIFGYRKVFFFVALWMLFGFNFGTVDVMAGVDQGNAIELPNNPPPDDIEPPPDGGPQPPAPPPDQGGGGGQQPPPSNGGGGQQQQPNQGGGEQHEQQPPQNNNTPAPNQTAQTATEQPQARNEIAFGSSSYRWDIGESSQIGIYANSGTAIGSFEIVIEYDSSMLRYVSGAESRNGNRLVISGTGNSNSHRRMLNFEPLRDGNTNIRIVSAVVRTVADANGNDAEIAVDISARAPITINRSMTVNKLLQELFISPAGIDFYPDVFEYEVSVDDTVSELDIGYVAFDERAVVTISDPVLDYGENTITITVEGNTGEPQVYTLLVIRAEPLQVLEAEPEPLPAAEPEPVIEEPESVEVGNFEPEDIIDEHTDISDFDRAYYFSWKIALGFVAVLLILALIARQVYENFYLRNKILESDNDIKIINLDEIVINVSRVSMQFKMADEESSSLKEYIIRTLKGNNCYRVL
ncbi:MAG: hypothetical protein FWC09_09110, partial [Lachnospiraceae bacterium]|nr:hypothetical protein [Lachnospiraceae bacterium]